jgi:hypothetical protein
MVAAITFVIAGIAAAAHYALIGRVVGGGWTVWQVWSTCTCVASLCDVWRLRDVELRIAWLVMALAWAASLFIWRISPDPLVDLAAKNLIVMLALSAVSPKREVMICVALHGTTIAFAFLAAYGLIPSSAQRPRAFLAWSYPDIASGLQHAAFIVLGGFGFARSIVLGSGSDGRHLDTENMRPVYQKDAAER